ncbi:MAG TPA: tetratricopeptide repeat protein, partial [Steroidobacteraceae bacterium]
MADRDTLRQIQALTQSGDVTQAANLAEEALTSGLEHPFVLNLVAVKREHEGRPEAAVDLLRRALEIAPDDIGCRHALGILLNSLETPREALEHFDAVIAAHPDFAPAHACRGAALEALGVLDAAAEAYRRALELQAGNLIALAGLASLHSRRGEHKDARQFAGQVLRVEPNFPNAVMSLAAADIALGAAEKAETLLRDLLADPRPTRLEKALARGALADALDAQGRFREAFDAYASANEERRVIYASRFAHGRSTLELAQAMQSYFQRTSRGSWRRSMAEAAAPSGTRGHVFLIGFPRSGT